MPKSLKEYILPEVFNPYVIHRTNELSAFIQSGIIVGNTELDALASAGGKLINMPFWEDLTGDDEVLVDGGALTPAGIRAEKDVAVLLQRGKAWKSTDLQAALSGDDPMGAIGDLVAAFWARKRQQTVLKELEGVFKNEEDMAGNIYKYTTFTKENAAQEILTAAYKLGDAQTKITGIVCNSADALNIDLQNMASNNAQYFSDFTTKDRAAGRSVLVDDSIPKGTIYLFGQGAIGLGMGSLPVMTETDRDSLAGVDFLVNRQAFLLHPRGIRWTNASVAGDSPTNEELANASNWERVYDAKDIRIVKMMANA